MPVDRTTAARLAEETAAVYQQLELELIRGVAGRLADGIASPDWATNKLVSVGQVRRWADEAVRRVNAAAGETVARSLVAAYGAGGDEALRELAAAQSTHPEWVRLAGIDRPGPKLTEMIDKRRGDLGALLREVNRALPNAGALNRLIATTVTKIDATRLPVLRRTEDIYRQTIARTGVPSVLAGAQTRRQAAQQVYASLTKSGVTGFVDQSGRGWSLPGYVDMATRTATAQAAVEGHLDRLGDAGLDLVIVSDVAGECKLCRRWEGKVLTRGGVYGKRTLERESEIDDEMVKVDVAGSVSEATGAGLLHPNAVLGEHRAGPLGEVENAVWAVYRGPSVHFTTTTGNDLTVSPNHPVLTPGGWVRADNLREGDHVFHGTIREGVVPGHEGFDQTPATFQDVFDAVAAVGRRTSVTATADDFHGDGRSYEGEIHVVWAERALLRELNPAGSQQVSENDLMWSDVQTSTLPRERAQLLGAQRVGSSIAGTLPDSDPSRHQPSLDRRIADAGTVREILAGLPCQVALDEIVHIERNGSFVGHAYDLQTTTGAYLAANIVIHNCRHSLSAYLPGLTPPHGPTEDPKGDADRQKLRALERRKRDLLRQQAAVAPFNGGKAPAPLKAKLDQVNADIKAHVAGSDLRRQPERERIDLGLRGGVKQPSKRSFAERADSAAQGEEALAAAKFGLDRKPRPDAFTSTMSRSVNTYTGSEYNAINRHLRGQILPYGYAAEDVLPHIQGVDLAMSASSLSRDVLTHRGLVNAEPLFGDRLSGDLAGMEWREDAYLSTTASARKAAGFAGQGGVGRSPMVMRVLAPAGTPAIEASGVELESEILMRRGLRLRVVADHGLSPEGVRQVDVEILGD